MKLLALAIVAAATLTATAHAGDLYVVGSVGQSRLDVKKSDYDTPLTAAGVKLQSSSLSRTDTAWKAQVGYRFSEVFAVEGGYVDLGKATYSATATGGVVNGSLKASGLNLAAVGNLPLGDAFTVFGKLGVIAARVEGEVSASGVGGSYSGSNSSTNLRGNWGIGASYAIDHNFAVRVEAEQFSKLGDNKTFGKKSDVNVLSAGIQYTF